MPEVSIIVPNYNHAPYLASRLESIFRQDFTDFEIIILDDCSTDESREIIEQYRNRPQVSHIVYNDKNTGNTFEQWHKGIKLTRGNYVWLAESDDWCEPSLLSTLVNGIKQDKECVLSYCQSYCVITENKIKWQSKHDYLSEMIDGKVFIEKYLTVVLAIFNASMAIWKREEYERISKEYMDFRMCGDWFFWIELSKSGKVHISGKLLNYFRKHDADVTSKVYGSGLNFIEELQVLNKLHIENLVGEATYQKAVKKRFKQYWLVKGHLTPHMRDKIGLLFKNSFSSGMHRVKSFLSAIWQTKK